jgi:hypothetical protein
MRKFFTAEGNLPTDVFRRWMEREGAVRAQSREASYLLRDLYSAVQKEFGISIGSKAVKGLSEVPAAFVEKMNRAMLGEIPMGSLPEGVRGPLTEMRAMIDGLSQKFIDEGLASDELAVQFKENFGTYMTRSYRIFDEKADWVSQIPPETLNKARVFLTQELQKKNPNATLEDGNRRMMAMLQDWVDSGDQRTTGGRGAKIGSKDMSLFFKRGDIAPELRALMGEYKDPAANFLRSVTKMVSTLESHKFLNDVKARGMGTYLFEDGKQPEGYSAKIAAEGSATMEPLNGLRTTPEIAEAFREFGKAADPGGVLFRSYMSLVGISKGAKTVGSLMTQVRNAQQFWFFAMNGHYDMTTLKEGVMATGADLGLTNNPKWQAFYLKMMKLGVVNQSTQAGELRDTLKDSILPVIDTKFGPVQGATQVGKNLYAGTIGAAARMYQISDDVGKVMGFLNERARQEKVHPEWTAEELDAEAVRRIKLTYPSYDMVPEAVKLARRQPVLGPFMTFAYESFRTSYHNLRFTGEAIMNARQSQGEIRKAYAIEAATRMGGQMAVLGGAGLGMSLLSRAILGITAEEEDDARKFLAPWDKNSQLVFTGKEDGKLQYLNLSFSNPYSLIIDPIGAVVRSASNEGDVLGAVGNAVGEFFKPFISESILSAAVMDVARNKRATTGGPVYNEADTPDQKVRAVLGRFWEAFEPGTITRVRTKMIPAARGETRRGVELDLTTEVLSEITGFKRQTVNFKDALGFKGSDFSRTMRESDSILRNVVLREGSVTAEEIAETYERSEGQRFELWKELHETAMAAVRRGVPLSEVKAALAERGAVPKATVTDIVQGHYRPQELSADSKKRLKQLKRPVPVLTSPFKGKVLSDGKKPKPPTPAGP